MPYFDRYKSRVLRYGSTEKERVENKLIKDFASLCSKSPDMVQFTYLGQIYTGILSSGARSAAQSESKLINYLLGPRSILLPEGAVVTIFDSGYNKTRYWIVMNAEFHSFYGYFKYKMLELDYMLNYIGTDGLKHTIPCYINGTGTFDIKEYFKYSNKALVQKPNRALNIVWATTSDIDSDCRFVIGNEIWRYIESDKISIPGISYSTLYAVGIDNSEDNLEEEIAHTTKLNSIKIITNYSTINSEEEEDTIYIPLVTENLKFYLVENGQVIDSDFTYTINNNFAEENEDGTLTVLGDDGSIGVKDTNTAFETTLNFATDQLENYFYIIGNTTIDAYSENYYDVNTDISGYTFTFDSSKILVEKNGANGLKVTAKGEVGTTTINFYNGNAVVFTLDLKVKSSWR